MFLRVDYCFDLNFTFIWLFQDNCIKTLKQTQVMLCFCLFVLIVAIMPAWQFCSLYFGFSRSTDSMILTASPWTTGGDHWDVLVLCGRRLCRTEIQ